MKERFITGFGCRLAICFLALLLPALNAAEVMVFGAASLSESLREIGAMYEKQCPDRILFNFGASSVLARQIEEGAGADIFFSADDAKMDFLEKKGLVEAGSRKSRLGNSLVVVVVRGSDLPLSSARDLAGSAIHRIALAEPTTVPAGIYAKEYLTSQDLWEAVEKKVIPTENVRAALAAVESGNVDAGIVYKTDAAISAKVRVAVEVTSEAGPKINYPVALMKDSKNKEASRKFLDHLHAEPAGKIFQKYGFVVRE